MPHRPSTTLGIAASSSTIVAIGAVSLGVRGLNFGIDFESGTRVRTELNRSADENGVRDAISPDGFGDAETAIVGDAPMASMFGLAGRSIRLPREQQDEERGVEEQAAPLAQMALLRCNRAFRAHRAEPLHRHGDEHDDLAARGSVVGIGARLAVHAQVLRALLDQPVRLAGDDEQVLTQADVERLGDRQRGPDAQLPDQVPDDLGGAGGLGHHVVDRPEAGVVVVVVDVDDEPRAIDQRRVGAEPALVRAVDREQHALVRVGERTLVSA